MRPLKRRVLVVGTTSDYVDILHKRFPERAIFLTDLDERARAREIPPDEMCEVVCDLSDHEGAIAALRKRIDGHGIELSGIACYDCESMLLAAEMSRIFSLPYPAAEAVAASRNKLVSKDRWRRAGVPCPASEVVEREKDALRFMERSGGAVVLKPATGSGSELTFLCMNETECSAAFRTIESTLASNPGRRLYAPLPGNGAGKGRGNVFVVEELVEGCEFSCDFILESGRLEFIRFAKKIISDRHTFGTALAYIVPAELPRRLDIERFRLQVIEAARVLGLDRAICMLDFIVRDGQAVLLELTPRPGGDCIPFLVKSSSGFDTLGCTLDFAEGHEIEIPEPSRWKRLVGVRLIIESPGVVRRIDTTALCRDPRVREYYLKHGPGHRIVPPPHDYDSRILGHVIFEPASMEGLMERCLEVAGGISVEIGA